MPEIQTIGINYIGINAIPLPNINFSIPQTPPVTLSIGSPIIDVPGCVKYNPANKNSIELVNQDERGSRVMCDGTVPWFEPMDYQPENLVYVQEQSVPPVNPTPELETPQPNLDIPETPPKEDVPYRKNITNCTSNYYNSSNRSGGNSCCSFHTYIIKVNKAFI